VSLRLSSCMIKVVASKQELATPSTQAVLTIRGACMTSSGEPCAKSSQRVLLSAGSTPTHFRRRSLMHGSRRGSKTPPTGA